MKKRFRGRATFAFFSLVAITMVLSEEAPNWWIFSGLWLIAAAALGFWAVMGRCPNCGYMPGLEGPRHLFDRSCPRCGDRVE